MRRWLPLIAAGGAALLFAVHPVHVEAVANVVGRAELMAASGVLAMILLHQRGSPWAPVAFAFALFSKEHAVVAPLLIACVMMYETKVAGREPVTNAPNADVSTRRLAPRVLFTTYALVVLAWVAALAIVFRGQQLAAVDPFWQSMSAPHRWLTVLGIIPVWLRLWFFPWTLSADYSPQITQAWPDNIASAALGAVIIAAAALLLARTRRSAPLVVLAILWIVVTMATVANVVVPTGLIIGERTLYLSSVGAVTLVAMLLMQIAKQRRQVAVACFALLFAAGCARTWTRNDVWRSDRSLFLSTAAQNPLGSWTHVALARIYSGNGGFPQAAREFATSLRLFDQRPDLWGEAIQAANRADDPQLADSLVAEAMDRYPRDYFVSIARGSVSIRKASFPAALAAARMAIAAAPDSAAGHLLAGIAFMQLGQRDSAVVELSRVSADHPMRAMADSVLAAHR